MAELTDVERQLVHAVEGGTVLDLADAPDRRVRARVIRDVLCGVLASSPDPRGLRLREALVEGELDLNDVRTTQPVELESCTFTGTVQLNRAHLSSLDLTGSEFTSLSGWYLDCEHDVSLTDALLANSTGPALNADGIHTTGTMFLDEDFHASSASADGTVRLLAAHIGGRLTLTGSTITNSAGPAIYADNARIDGDLWIDHCHADGHSEHATLSIIDVTIAGDLKLSAARLTNDLGPALNADGMHVNGNVFIDDSFHATGHSSRGVIRLPGARITGQLSVDGARFTTQHGGLTLDLTGVHIADELILDADSFITDESFQLDCDGLQYQGVPRRARRHDVSSAALRIPLTTCSRCSASEPRTTPPSPTSSWPPPTAPRDMHATPGLSSSPNNKTCAPEANSADR